MIYLQISMEIPGKWKMTCLTLSLIGRELQTADWLADTPSFRDDKTHLKRKKKGRWKKIRKSSLHPLNIYKRCSVTTTSQTNLKSRSSSCGQVIKWQLWYVTRFGSDVFRATEYKPILKRVLSRDQWKMELTAMNSVAHGFLNNYASHSFSLFRDCSFYIRPPISIKGSVRPSVRLGH